jgi:hypothetical protein
MSEETGACMKTISNTLDPIIGRWDDPGDYPSGAGGGPLASEDYVEYIDGELVLTLESVDFAAMETNTPSREALVDYISDHAPEAELANVKVTKWCVGSIDFPRITLSVEDFESDGVPEKDCDD